MNQEEIGQFRKKFRNLFRLVTQGERYQRPQLDDRANTIIRMFQFAEPMERWGDPEFQPIPAILHHPAIRRSETEGNA